MIKVKRQVYGALSVRVHYNSETQERYVTIWDGYTCKAAFRNGKLERRLTWHDFAEPIYFTTAQFYRICRKHFSGKNASELPEEIREILTRTYEDDMEDDWDIF
jgi:hypothetical protein